MKYHSKIDPQQLLLAASAELAESDPGAFLALLLALGSGLRRAEIDRLLWRQVHPDAIHVEITEVSSLKSVDSHGAVAIDSTLSSILQGFRARAKSEYVIESDTAATPPTAPWGRRYRCQSTFDRLIGWLRARGIDSRSPIHVLRKESGSLIATQHGIYAASRFLRHADLQVTAMHYVDHKARVTVDMSGLLAKNISELPSKAKRASGS